ncbi:MAG: 5'-methylthioadenosine/adenosylhomocysteine nucleosidase, partial [Bariatricus sp.]
MIGIIGAMEEEVAHLKEAMQVEETVERAAMTFVKGKLDGKDVVVVRSGIGKVNA